MKLLNILVYIFGVYFAFAALFFIYSSISKNEEITQYLFGGKLMPFTRIGVLAGLLMISIYFLFTKSKFKYHFSFGVICLIIWIVLIISAIYYLRSIY
jgi:hypothetical protein